MCTKNPSRLDSFRPPIPQGFQIPHGLEAIYAHCCDVYPNQPNPLQYWLGGSDPLDFVSMYFNPGNAALAVPPHWHYVSMGLSDLYGDGRVHPLPESGKPGPSGCGFELTFRLKPELTGDKSNPPTWPAALLQALARYAINCGQGGSFSVGDWITWDRPLDGSLDSQIREMIFAEDPQLKDITTRHGCVNFLQVVGICKEEFEAAQRWNGHGVLKLLQTNQISGGRWHICDPRRIESIFQLNPAAHETLDNGIAVDGSNLTCVVARVAWKPWNISVDCYAPEGDDSRVLQSPDEYILANRCVWPPEPLEGEEFEESSTNGENVEFIPALELIMDFDGAQRFPLMLKGRLLHGRHFTFKCISGRLIVTFALRGTVGVFATPENPIARRGKWINILLGIDQCHKMCREVRELDSPDPSLAFRRKSFDWPEASLKLTIMERN